MNRPVLLIGPHGHGGEGVYMQSLREHPPPGFEYDVSADHHASAAGARCQVAVEICLNQVVHRLTIPDIGLRALKLSSEYDLVHVHAHPTLLRGLGNTPLVMSEGSSSAVYLCDYLGWTPRKLRRRYGWTRQIYRMLGIHDRVLTSNRAAKVYFFSHWARELNLRHGADPAKLEVIYPGFPIPEAVERSARSQFTFLFVGRDFERKGGYETVEAFAEIAGDLPDVHLVIAGSDLSQPNPDLLVHSWASPARRERVTAQLRELVAAGRITHHRWVESARLRTEIYPAADAFLMPTHAEGFGFTNVEAMSFGLPVVTSLVGPAAEVVGDRRAGLLVTPGDVGQLADAMHALATDPQLARRLGDAGRQDFLARFTRERFQARLADLYASVLATS